MKKTNIFTYILGFFLLCIFIFLIFLIYQGELLNFLEKWDYIIGLFGFIFGSFLLFDKNTGLIEKSKHFILKLFGFNCQFVFLSIFDCNMKIEELKPFFIDEFKKTYNSQVNIYPSKENLFEFTVNNEFNIKVWENVDNEIMISTNKYKTMIKTLSQDIKNIIITLNNIQKKITSEFKEEKSYFNEKEIDIELYLPYSPKFFKFYNYKKIKIKDYEMKLLHSDYNTKIKLKLGSIKLNSKDNQEILELIQKVI